MFFQSLWAVSVGDLVWAVFGGGSIVWVSYSGASFLGGSLGAEY